MATYIAFFQEDKLTVEMLYFYYRLLVIVLTGN